MYYRKKLNFLAWLGLGLIGLSPLVVAQAKTSGAPKPLSIKTFERLTRGPVRAVPQAQIHALELMTANTPRQSRAEIYFRLAEYYRANSKYYDAQAHQYNRYRNSPRWLQYQNQRQEAHATAQMYRKKAAAGYYRIVKLYPTYHRLCASYYFLGKNLFEMDQQPAALNVYRPMLRLFQYPLCPFIPNVYLAFGEYYFKNKQLNHALSFYQRVLSFPNNRSFGFALYKMGWCYYQLGQYRAAWKQFMQAKREAAKGRSNYHMELQKRALEGIVLVSRVLRPASNRAYP